MSVEIAVTCEEIKKCANELNKLSSRIRNCKLPLNISVNKGDTAAKLVEVGEALETAAARFAEVVEKAAATANKAADTFNRMDESLKY